MIQLKNLKIIIKSLDLCGLASDKKKSNNKKTEKRIKKHPFVRAITFTIYQMVFVKRTEFFARAYG